VDGKMFLIVGTRWSAAGIEPARGAPTLLGSHFPTKRYRWISYPAIIHFSLARGEDSSIQISDMSWYIISMATGLIP